jgi:hypothetical protein
MVPSSEKSQRLSPCAVAASELPPAAKARYCVPFHSKTLTVEFAPAPVWKLQSSSPLSAS